MDPHPESALTRIVRLIQHKLGRIPADGVAITALVYFLSPEETKWRNTFAVAAVHGLLHEQVCHAQHEDEGQRMFEITNPASNLRFDRYDEFDEMSLNNSNELRKSWLNI